MVHFVIGMILTGLGVWGIVVWWNVFGFVMRGVIPFFLLFLGLVAIIASCRRAEEDSASASLPDYQPAPDDLLDANASVVGGATGSPLRAR